MKMGHTYIKPDLVSSIIVSPLFRGEEAQLKQVTRDVKYQRGHHIAAETDVGNIT